jgi:hypothetical protein
MLLDPGMRASLYQRLLGLVQGVLEGRVHFALPVTTQRLCSTVAIAAALSGSESCDSFLQQCVVMGMTAGGGAGPRTLAVDLMEVGP